MDMKTIFKIVTVSLLTFILFACSKDVDGKNSMADDEITDELVIFNWTSYMPDEVIKDFEEEFGVKVTYTTFASNQEMLTKVRSGTVAYDIAVPSTTYVQIMVEEGLLQEINFDNIPNYKNISDQWKGLDHDPDDKYSVTYLYGYSGLIYNKDKLPEAPTSWEDLWNTDYQGHVILMEAPDEINYVLQQSLGNKIQNPDEEQIEAAGELFETLLPNVMKFSEAPKAELVNGDAWLAYGYSGEAAVAYYDNPSIDFVLPKEGGVRWADEMVIPNTAENKATAEAFINYLLRPEVSKKLSDAYPYNNPNVEALKLFSEEELQVPGLSLPEELVEKVELPAPLTPEQLQGLNKAIQEAKVNAGK